MNHDITTDTRVRFDSDEGPQTGTVIGVLRDIGNGQGFAVVEIDHPLPGIVSRVPLNELKREGLAA